MCPGWIGLARVINITKVGRMTSAAAAKSRPWFCCLVLSATGSAFRLPDLSYIQLFAQPVECLSRQNFVFKPGCDRKAVFSRDQTRRCLRDWNPQDNSR